MSLQLWQVTRRTVASGGDGAGATSESSDTTHFGFREVPRDSKATLVREVFENVAPSYDVMNDIMSGTLHRGWKDDFVRTLAPRPGIRHIDVAGGTGDVAFRIYDQVQRRMPATDDSHRSDIYVADINPAMLSVGQQRAIEKGYTVETSLGDADQPAATPGADARTTAGARLHFIECNAEVLNRFEDNFFDSYTIAFGIRNVTNIPAALAEAARVLRPGGRFLCLEFSRVQSYSFRTAYEAYSSMVIPAMGQVVAGDRESYQYLVESIQRFPAQEDFAEMVRGAGFQHVQHTNYLDGIVAVHSGFKLS